jgi:hypothetical protein
MACPSFSELDLLNFRQFVCFQGASFHIQSECGSPIENVVFALLQLVEKVQAVHRKFFQVFAL